MKNNNLNLFTAIHSEGALLPMDLLQRIREKDATLCGLDEKSYHLAPSERLTEAISHSWNRLSGLWLAFKAARGKLRNQEFGTTLTRENWLLPLFEELNFGRLTTSSAVEIDGKTYPISHQWQKVPIHLVSCNVDLDKRTAGVTGAARISPHSLLQEYLNLAQEAQWGIVSNGLLLRLLRDNVSLTRQAYLEFDLETMFEGEVYADFVLLWLICHQSRFEVDEQQGECILESWFKSARESGIRALDDLRRGVEEAITCLGQGFLQHPWNKELRERLKNGSLSIQDYYRQLLRLVYRLLFLFAAEDRELLLMPEADTEAKRRYMDYYSTTRLRSLAAKQRGSRHHDLYEGLRLVMQLLGSDQGCPQLALPALGGFLFDPNSTKDIIQAKLSNQVLLSAVRSLAFIQADRVRRAVDYRNLGPEELGSVYESLLELHPRLNADSGSFELFSAAGNERKTSGSYYTPSSLIQTLLDSALEPLIEARLKGKEEANRKEQALLELKICDPASGSGHFLIAAAHRLAARLAKLRAGGNEPSPLEIRRALRDVISRCIYGVDLNPMAVELCKVNLWLEALEPGKPLSFLDAHIKCGNSLVGLGPKMDLQALEVPDEAFEAVSGDDKPTASRLKKRNRQERFGQESMFVAVGDPAESLNLQLAEQMLLIEDLPQESATEVQAKAEAYRRISTSAEYTHQRQIADVWTAAFFWKIEQPQNSAAEVLAPTQGQLRRLRRGLQLQRGLLEEVERLRKSQGFFHWALEFPQVFFARRGKLTAKTEHSPSSADLRGLGDGFDCVLGNPPWERIKLQEKEFFAAREPEIAAALNKAQRGIQIEELKQSNLALYREFEAAKHAAECSSKFMRKSQRYPLSGRGDVNTYALFAEHAGGLINSGGRAGIIVQTGIATDDNNKELFGDLVERGALVSLYDFSNREKIFPAVHNDMKFSLLTLAAEPQNKMEFVFYAKRVQDLQDRRRRITLAPAEINLFNPNTRTLPLFRTRAELDINRWVYNHIPIIADERRAANSRDMNFLMMFQMANDSHLFSQEQQTGFVPLMEAKMFWQYDHRWKTYEGEMTRAVCLAEKQNPQFSAQPRYWVAQEELAKRLKDYPYDWLIAFRNIAHATNQRTAIFALLPKVGVGHTATLLFLHPHKAIKAACLLGNANSLVFDFSARCKVGGTHMDKFIVEQLPLLPAAAYSAAELDFIVPRVLELSYTTFDLQPYAKDVLDEIGAEQWQSWFPHNRLGADGLPQPFSWDEERRARLRAELDVFYARLYELSRKQLRYILDPADLTPRELEDMLDPWEEVEDALQPQGYENRCAVSTFPSETFAVLKREEIKTYGEYRTRRLVLEAWEQLQGSAGSKPEGGREVITAASPQTVSAAAEKQTAAARSAAAAENAQKKQAADPPAPGEICLYKCSECNALVLGFGREEHIRKQHGGRSVTWKKMN